MKNRNRLSGYWNYIPNKPLVNTLTFISVLAILSITFLGCSKMFDSDLKVSNSVADKTQQVELNNYNTNTLSVRTILAPQNITDVTGHFFVDSEATPFNTPYMIVRWQDNENYPGNAISQNVTYDPGGYTGFTPPNPRSDWQRGQFDDSVSVSPVFQLNGTSGGMMMNSWFDTWKQIIGGGEGVTYGYNFSPYPGPWTTDSSELWIQAYLKLPWFANWDINKDGNAPVGQLSFVIYLHDTSVNMAIAVVVNVFDNRPNPSDNVSWDTHTYFVGTYLGATRYVTPNLYSQSWQMNTWDTSEFFRAEITRQNLINIATDINNKYGTNLSYNPANYVLTLAGIMQETFREEGDQVSMGSSFDGFSVYEAY